MSWRNISRNIVSPSHKHNSYKNFGSYKKKDRNSSKLDTILRKGVYGGNYGFIQKTRSLAKDEQYKNFNVKSTKMTMGQTRCGVIAFNRDLTMIICICNKCIYDKYGIKQWGLPKGHMEKDDRVYSNCASREFFEETGVRYNIIQNKFELNENVSLSNRIKFIAERKQNCCSSIISWMSPLTISDLKKLILTLILLWMFSS